MRVWGRTENGEEIKRRDGEKESKKKWEYGKKHRKTEKWRRWRERDYKEGETGREKEKRRREDIRWRETK